LLATRGTRNGAQERSRAIFLLDDLPLASNPPQWLSTKESAMSIDIEQLRNFQSRELEQPNLQTNGRQPVFTKTIEWSLLEIVILLTEIRDGINAVANKR